MSASSAALPDSKADEGLTDDMRRRVVRLAAWHNINCVALIAYHMRHDLDVVEAAAWIRWWRETVVQGCQADVALFEALPIDGVCNEALRRDIKHWCELTQKLATGSADRLCLKFGLQPDGSDPSKDIPRQNPPEHLLQFTRLGPETGRTYKIASRAPLTEDELRHAWTAYRNHHHVDLTKDVLSRALGMINADLKQHQDLIDPRMLYLNDTVTKP